MQRDVGKSVSEVSCHTLLLACIDILAGEWYNLLKLAKTNQNENRKEGSSWTTLFCWLLPLRSSPV